MTNETRLMARRREIRYWCASVFLLVFVCRPLFLLPEELAPSPDPAAFYAGLPDVASWMTNPATAAQAMTATTPLKLQMPKAKRRLEFIHIPKTGGTAIESLAAKHGIPWSVCHFARPDVPPKISDNATHCPPGSLKHSWPNVPKFYRCPWWHVPPQYFEFEWMPFQSPYTNSDLFAVVRNPYDRLLSQYYYSQSALAQKNDSKVNSLDSLEHYMQLYMVRRATRAQRGCIAKNVTGNEIYFINSGHFIPQYDFIFDEETQEGDPDVGGTTRQLVKHVLKFESLESDFSALMDAYNLSHIRLSEMRHVRPNTVKRKFDAHDLSPEVREAIETYYAKDFEVFGYEKLGRAPLD